MLLCRGLAQRFFSLNTLHVTKEKLRSKSSITNDLNFLMYLLNTRVVSVMLML